MFIDLVISLFAIAALVCGLLLSIGGAVGLYIGQFYFQKPAKEFLLSVIVPITLITFVLSSLLIWHGWYFSGCIFFSGVFLMAVVNRNGIEDAE